MHNITILRSGSQSLCKRFSLDAGVVKSKRASMPAYFTFESQTVDGIEDFVRLLTDLEQDRNGFIVEEKPRGEPPRLLKNQARLPVISPDIYLAFHNT
jgi:hypothetical protein